MKNKFLKIVIKVAIIVFIIIAILLSSNLIYKFAIKYNIVEEVGDTSNTASDTIENDESKEITENKDIRAILNKLYPIDLDSKYIKNFSSQYNGIEAYINGENVNIIVRSEASKHFSGLISNTYFEGNESIRADVSTKKKIKTLLVGYYQDALSSEFMNDVPYIFFLMEDGTVEYIDLKILLKNGYLSNPATTVRTRGKIKDLSKIVKLEQCNLANEEDGYSTAVAIGTEGKIYNLFEYSKWGE